MRTNTQRRAPTGQRASRSLEDDDLPRGPWHDWRDGTHCRGWGHQRRDLPRLGEALPGPTLPPGDVVVIDNFDVHKVAGVCEAIATVGARAVYVPPYSPNFNPIELIFSKIKGRSSSVSA